MLTLFRGGPAMWLSIEDAERIGVADNDWLEVYNRHGTVACRAVVSHRIPNGVALFYHSQDRHVNVPVSRDLRRPRRHRQLADPDLDEADPHDRRLRAALLGLQLLRADRPPARRADHRPQAPHGGRVLMRVRAQVGMVMNLDKCIGCHTCSVTCKNVWTNRRGRRVRLVQQRRDEARPRLPARLRGPGALERRLEARPQGRAEAEGRRHGCRSWPTSSGTPTCRASTTTTSPGPTTTST